MLAAPLLLLACTVPMIGGPPLAAPERPTAPVVEAPAEPAGSATLQDCGNWPRSVLCDVENRGRGLVQLRAIASSGYSRAEAELIVHALYLGILGREPDEASFGAAVAEVQRGNLEAQVEPMTRSGEFLQLLSDINSSDLLERLYRDLLGRPVDSGGMSTYLRELQFHRYAEVVLRIIRSPEFEDRLAREAR